MTGKVLTLMAFVLISRIGVYVPIQGVDREAFAAALQGSTTGAASMISYVDNLTGGSISRLGVFTLGIVPYINASIVFQLLSSAFPELKEMQREGPTGRKKVHTIHTEREREREREIKRERIGVVSSRP